jgi:hypothetical protein
MKKTLGTIFTILLLHIFCSSCNLGGIKEQANKQFGDQHFKTAIALIELHKVRFGTYPESLDSLKYAGDWDKIINGSVHYEKLDSGYVLDLVNGWMGKPNTLTYPDEFWQGLGLVKSNMKP